MKRKVLVLFVGLLIIILGVTMFGCNKPSKEPNDMVSLVDSMIYYENFTYNDVRVGEYRVASNNIYFSPAISDLCRKIIKKEGEKYFEYDIVDFDESVLVGVKKITENQYKEEKEKCFSSLNNIKRDFEKGKVDVSDPTKEIHISKFDLDNVFSYKNNELEINSYNSENRLVGRIKFYNFNSTEINMPTKYIKQENNIVSKYLNFIVNGNGEAYMRVSKDGHNLKFDTNPLDMVEFVGAPIYLELKNFIEYLGLPSYVFEDIMTSTDKNNRINIEGYVINWTFSSNSGLEGSIRMAN